MGTTLEVDAGAFTHVGRRSQNEDSHAVRPTLGLFLVADGMGGYEGGEVASALTSASMCEFIEANQRDPEGTWPCKADRARSYEENLLRAAAQLAHREIAVRRLGVLREMGSTVAAMLCRGARAVVGHVGDSRVYRLRQGALEALTRDHSMQAEAAAQGFHWPHRNVITRALGIDGRHDADLRTLALEPGDVFLLCSDGLYEVMPEAEVASLLAQGSAAQTAQALVEAAVQRGASDNVTAVVVRVRAAPG